MKIGIHCQKNKGKSPTSFLKRENPDHFLMSVLDQDLYCLYLNPPE